MEFFQSVNQGLANPFFDFLMPILRNKFTWLPLYVFMIAFALVNFKWKGAWLVFCLVVAVGVGDTLSSKLIKKTVKRPRPCKTEQLLDEIQMRTECGSGYSFTSSHATNHFAIGVFLFLAVGGLLGKYRWLIILWAASISFAQVYVGVHFPFDVFGGALLGTIIGYAFGKYYLMKSDQWFQKETGEINQKGPQISGP